MTDEDLRALLRGGEGQRVEFKRAAQRDPVKNTVVAFANRAWEPEPAVLFVGVEDNGTVVGVPNPDQTQKDIRGYIIECYPSIEGWEVRPLEHEGKIVVAVIVPESTNSPHFTGSAYVRQGSQSVRANADQYARLLTNHLSVARALGPWEGKEILVEQEETDSVGRRHWTGSQKQRKVVSVTALGLVLDGGGYFIRADWSRVKLQPNAPGKLPYVRVSLD